MTRVTPLVVRDVDRVEADALLLEQSTLQQRSEVIADRLRYLEALAQSKTTKRKPVKVWE